jgi:hypothetical protein
MQSISIGTCVDRMSQGREDSIGRGGLPLQLPDAAPALAAKSQSQVIHDQIAEDRVCGAEFLELLEDQADHPPRLLVGLPGSDHHEDTLMGRRKVVDDLDFW